MARLRWCPPADVLSARVMKLRAKLYDVLIHSPPPGSSALGNATRALLQTPRSVLGRLNETFGRPLAPAEELAARRDAQQRLQVLRQTPRAAQGDKVAAARPQAPLAIYHEADRNLRERSRLTELLESKGWSYRLIDVVGDPAALAFALSRARVKQDDLPVLFVADEAFGTYNEVVAADVAGKLAKSVFPAS